MGFLEELKKTTNETLTENGALAYKTTLDPVLDFFSLAGAMRENQSDAVKLFVKAYKADPGLALRCLFYLRDIRGGQGERETFRACLKKLHSMDSAAYGYALQFIPEYGRWDDMFAAGIGEDVIREIEKQFYNDIDSMKVGGNVSLMAKWLPSENASSKVSRQNARIIANRLCLTGRQYRKEVVALRKYIDLLEQKMSANAWESIEYSSIPSQAFSRHAKAFSRHDGERFEKFISQAKNGEVKLNTSTLYTYEVYEKVNSNGNVADALWANLPDYTNGKNAIVLADVSGSMSGRPMSVSVSLALYFAERNSGPFNGCFMTFSAKPQVVEVRGDSLTSKFRNIELSNWDMNTNLNSAFNAILKTAKKSKCSQEDLPSILYIISDMQFDSCVNGKSNLDKAKKDFADAGYTLPHVVFWNVAARNVQTPATRNDGGVTLLSGFSQSTFRYAVEGKTPLEFMVEVLTSDRYSNINF